VTRGRITLALIAAIGLGGSASAQTAAERAPHRFEASIGGMWLGGGGIGAADAELRRNAIPTTDFPIFGTDTDVHGSPGFDARVAYWLTRSIALEAGFVMTVPVVETRVTGDIEDAGDLTLEEDLDQYFVEASAVLMLDRFHLGSRTVPFVSGGAGYLRQLHEGQTLIETGQVYHVGGGIRHWLRLRDSGFLRAAGLRVDARVYLLANGFAFDDGARPHGAITGALFLTF
jgi:hypothetical protein